MVINGRYNWRGQTQRLVYLGVNHDPTGELHRFSLIGGPGKVWCEIRGHDLHMLAEAAPVDTVVILAIDHPAEVRSKLWALRIRTHFDGEKHSLLSHHRPRRPFHQNHKYASRSGHGVGNAYNH